MNDPRPSEIGQRLRRLRENHGLTVRALAQRSGIAASSIHGLEMGRQQSMSPLRLLRIARALGAPPASLIPELEA